MVYYYENNNGEVIRIISDSRKDADKRMVKKLGRLDKKEDFKLNRIENE